MKLSDLALGVLFVLLGGAVLLVASQMKVSPHFQYGAGFFPTILGGLLTLAGLWLAASDLRAAAARRGIARLVALAPWCRDRARLMNLAAVITALIGFVLLIEPLGFVVSSLVLLALLGYRFSGRPLLSALSAAGVVLFLYLFFQQLMGVPLPEGFLASRMEVALWTC
ncbi:tripartite tricarboxylate transporter TctB family protein [Stutzerimonas azotifigens]|uniref:Tripartite tricarboxylate transporter TctB family protein n=1 Tax=Stutzerimonas azotifigens TaxID=291995 RepID=A0ABR5Z4E0_9GAMM|nr:tripartite tricarboxylate transporter TctB family protein [Stutzerimonas azotifigens]MBA1275010.1 tripartite tricarboxylate transporter TctB family protein [Stutzerimonas azotifigens]